MAAKKSCELERTAITVPADLARKIRELRARGVRFNVSEVCTAAIRSALEDLDRQSDAAVAVQQFLEESRPTIAAVPGLHEHIAAYLSTKIRQQE